jgi:hypothetical protein
MILRWNEVDYRQERLALLNFDSDVYCEKFTIYLRGLQKPLSR